MSSTTGISRSTLLERLEAKTAEAEGIAGAFKVDDKGRFELSSAEFKNYRAAVAEARELKSALSDVDALADFRRELSAPAGSSVGASDQGARYSTLGDAFVESKAYQPYREGKAQFERTSLINTQVEGKSIFNLSAGQTTFDTLGSQQSLGIAELRRRQFHVRDLFPKSSTRASTLFGIRETGWTNNAAQVPQSDRGNPPTPATAPTSEIHLESVMYPIAEVAHIAHAHKNVLSDEPRLKSFINGRMVEGVKFREDQDLLFGAGGTERVTGIANTPGVQAYTGLATDKKSIQIRRAITKSLLAEYEPTGIVISPTRWEEVEIETDDSGTFRVAVAVAIGAEKKVWRVNVVETTAMSDDQFLLGAFGLGAQLHDREAVSVSVSSEHADNFAKGMVTFRADERLALEIPRPESFVLGTWTDAP